MIKTHRSVVILCVHTAQKRRRPPSVHLQRLVPCSIVARAPSSFSGFLGAQLPLRARRTQGWCTNCGKCRALQTRAAIFGVGAPEVIVVVVVALLVFGPRGLAQAAKSLGAALRTFQPTIRELAEVSTELKSTLEQEIGIDELRDDIRSLRSPLTSTPRPMSADEGVDQKTAGLGLPMPQPLTEDAAQLIDADIDRKREEAAKLAWGGQPPVGTSQQDTVDKADSLSALSTEELEAELARRQSQRSDERSPNEA